MRHRDFACRFLGHFEERVYCRMEAIVGVSTIGIRDSENGSASATASGRRGELRPTRKATARRVGVAVSARQLQLSHDGSYPQGLNVSACRKSPLLRVATTAP